jgi:predicted nucleic acid-binding protein
MPRLYLDCCCLNRPFDDIGQESIRIEVVALEIIMETVYSGRWILMGSDVLLFEINKIKDSARREALKTMLSFATEWVPMDPAIVRFAEILHTNGVDQFDALHLASAGMGGADVFLTVDKRLYRKVQRLQHLNPIRTQLPAIWLEELGEEHDT